MKKISRYSAEDQLVLDVLKRHHCRKRAVKQIELLTEILNEVDRREADAAQMGQVYHGADGPKSFRAMQRSIHRLTVAGERIASECNPDCNGYYIFTCSRDERRAERTLEGYLRSIWARLAAIRKHRARLAGQRRFIYRPQKAQRARKGKK